MTCLKEAAPIQVAHVNAPMGAASSEIPLMSQPNRKMIGFWMDSANAVEFDGGRKEKFCRSGPTRFRCTSACSFLMELFCISLSLCPTRFHRAPSTTGVPNSHPGPKNSMELFFTKLPANPTPPEYPRAHQYPSSFPFS